MLEILVLLDQAWSFSHLRYPICLLAKTGQEMLTFVRSMMEWLGGTISKEDVGEDGTGKRRNEGKRRRGDDDEEETALGAFALRFRLLSLLSRLDMIYHVEQTFGVFPQSSILDPKVSIQRSKTNTGHSRILIAWAVKEYFLRLCLNCRQCHLAHREK